jgi:hypothetical protein
MAVGYYELAQMQTRSTLTEIAFGAALAFANLPNITSKLALSNRIDARWLPIGSQRKEPNA